MGAMPSPFLNLFIYFAACDEHALRSLWIYYAIPARALAEKYAHHSFAFRLMCMYQRCTLCTTAKKKPRCQRDVIAFSSFRGMEGIAMRDGRMVPADHVRDQIPIDAACSCSCILMSFIHLDRFLFCLPLAFYLPFPS